MTGSTLSFTSVIKKPFVILLYIVARVDACYPKNMIFLCNVFLILSANSVTPLR